jgi:hypothetical protein
MTTHSVGDLTSDDRGQRADALNAVFDEVGVASETRVGAFRFYFGDQRWEWSEQVQRMHGYQPGAACVQPHVEVLQMKLT